MMAEVVVDVLNAALGVDGEVRQRRARRTAGPSRSAPAGCRTPTVAYAFRIFGRPPRTTACDCERAMEPALPQKLFLMADDTLLRQDQPAGQPAQADCWQDHKDDDEVAGRTVPGHADPLPDRQGAGEVRGLPRDAQGPPGRVRRHAVGADQHARVYLESLTAGFAAASATAATCSMALVMRHERSAARPDGRSIRGASGRKRIAPWHCVSGPTAKASIAATSSRSARPACLGLTLPQLLRWRAQAGRATDRQPKRRKANAVIMVWLGGGPATIDMWDLKPEAPEEHPRRVQADRHQGRRRPDQRAPAEDGQGHATRPPSSARWTTPSRRTARPRSS